MKKKDAFYRLTRMTLGEATVDDIVSLENDVGKALRENPVLRVGKRALRPKEEDFWQLRWSDLIELRQLWKKGDRIGMVKLIYGVSDRQMARVRLINYLAVYKWVFARLLEIAKKEEQELGGDPSAAEKAAGIEDLKRFGEAIALDELAGRDLLKHKKLLEKPYAVIFRKLCMDKCRSLIEKKLIENAGRKIRASH